MLNGIEVDPQRIGEGEDIGKNGEALVQAATMVLECVGRSVDKCPKYCCALWSFLTGSCRKIVKLCNVLKMEVEKKFEGFGVFAVGGLMFLR